MKVFYRDEQTAKHNNSFSPSAGKPALAVASWKNLGLPLEIETFEPATREQLYKVHAPKYVDGVLDLKCNNGFGNRLPEVATALPFVAGSMVAATLHALHSGETAFSPTSGAHHACFNHGEGFCTFNFIALAACEAFEAGARKVAIIDCDMHYGNGTDDIIYKQGLHFVSHYSFGGDRLSSYESSDEWLAKFPGIVEKLISSADVLIYNAGADPHVDDPLGGVLTTEQMKKRDEIVFKAASIAGVPVAVSLAGGYQPDIRNVLDVHDNTFKVACRFAAEKVGDDLHDHNSSEKYEKLSYNAGYCDGLKDVMRIVEQLKILKEQQELSDETAFADDLFRVVSDHYSNTPSLKRQ